MAEEGFRIAGAFVEVNLKDSTAADEKKIRERLERSTPVPLQAALQDPDNTRIVKERIKASAPAVIRTDADTRLAQAKIKELAARRNAAIVTIDADVAKAKARIDALEAKRGKTKLDVDAEIGKAQAKIEALTARKQRVLVQADVDDASVNRASDKAAAATKKVADRANAQFSAIQFAVLFAGMPVAAAAASAGTVAALGGVSAAFVGVGVLALKSNTEVAGAWSGLGLKLKDEAKSWAAPLAQPFVESASRMGGAADALSPQITRAFANTVPAVHALTGAVISFASSAMPGVVQATAAGVPVFDALNTAAHNVGSGVSDMFGNLSTGARGAGSGLVTLSMAVRDFLGFAGQLFANLSNNGGPALSLLTVGLHNVEQGILSLTQNGGGAIGFLTGFTGAATGMTAVLRAAAAVIGILPADLVQFAGAVAATTMVAQKFGVDAGAAFDGLGKKVKAAASGTGSWKDAFAGLVSGALNPTTLAIGAVSIGLSVLGQREKDAAAAAAAHAQQVSAVSDALYGEASANGASQRAAAAKALSDYKVSDGSRNLLGDVRALLGSDALPGLTDAFLGNKGAQDQLVASLRRVQAAHTTTVNTNRGLVSTIDDEGTKAKQTADILAQFGSNADAAGQQQRDLATATQSNTAAAAAALPALSALAAALQKNNAVTTAADNLFEAHKQALQQVATSSQAVANAQHALAQSGEAVVNAQHGVVQAQQAVADAQRGVENAEYGLATAQQAERTAQDNLNQARKDAIQTLKDLHLQLEDQIVSEQEAGVRLFDAEQAAAALGVNSSNAKAIAGQQVTAANEAQIKAALDLLAAENALNDAKNTGTQLRDKVADADAKGVEGSDAVKSAEQALRQAQEQVKQSADALAAAQRGVTEANYQLRQAHQAVADAQYGQEQASIALRAAEDQLSQAQGALSGALDINTIAGRNNLSMILQLANTIAASGMPANEQYRTLIDDVGRSLGISTQAAQDYLTKIGLIPRDFKYSVTAVAGANFDELNRVYNDRFGGRIGPVSQNTAHAFADGGLFRGAGGPRADANNVRISDGEYIVNAQQTAKNLPLLHAINSGKVGGDGAALPAFADGGLYKGEALNYFLSGAGAAFQQAVNVRDVMGLPHPPGLPVYVPPADVTGMVGYAAGAGMAQWAPQISQALAMLGQSQGWMGTVERRMMQESGGNPNAINLWDSNAAAGTPSVGLMQVIGPTYAAYRGPNAGPWAYGVSEDPLSNIYAGLNYAVHRYGSLSALNQAGGYDSGGYMLHNPGINSTGKPEMVLPPRMTETLEQVHAMVQSGAGHGIDYGALAEAVAAAVDAMFSGGIHATWDTTALERGLITLQRRRAGR